MKTAYTTPRIKVVRVHASGILCQSYGDSFGISPYDETATMKKYGDGDGYDFGGW